MKCYRSLIVAVALTLGACTTITNETSTTAVLEEGFNAGQRYEIRQRTLQGKDGSYMQTSVVYRGFAKTCIIDSPNDCESAARALIDQIEDSIVF